MTNETPSIPAGWYPDPSDPSRQRWWDGTVWTEQFAPAYSASVARAPEGTKPYTVWIWLVIALPVLGLIPFAMNVASQIHTGFPDMRTRDIVTLVVFGSTLVLAAAVVVCAYLDWRELKRRGVPAPFHWAFAFFALANLGVIYAIGRAQVVKARTGGSGGLVLGLAIGSIGLSVVLAVVIVVVVVSAAINGIRLS